MGEIEELLTFEDGIPADLLDELNSSYEDSFTNDCLDEDSDYNVHLITDSAKPPARSLAKHNLRTKSSESEISDRANDPDEGLNVFWLLFLPLVFFLYWLYRRQLPDSPMGLTIDQKDTAIATSPCSASRSHIQVPINLAQEEKGAYILRSCTTPPRQSWWCNNPLLNNIWDLGWLNQCPKIHETLLILPDSVGCWPLAKEFSIGVALGNTAKILQVSLRTLNSEDSTKVLDFSVYVMRYYGLERVASLDSGLTVSFISPVEASCIVIKGKIERPLLCATKLEVIGYFI